MTERPVALLPDSLADPPEDTAPGAGHLAFATDRLARVQALRVALEAVSQASSPRSEWVLELGCGHGHFLAAYATRHPALYCLGIDFCRDRIGRAHRKRQRSGLANLHFMHAEGSEFLAAVPKTLRFRQVFVLFPDPWPKRRHRKNRLVQGDFLERIAAVSTPGCELFFRSDALDYVAEVRAAVQGHPRWRWVPTGDLPLEQETVFQAKATHFESVSAVRVN